MTKPTRTPFSSLNELSGVDNSRDILAHLDHDFAIAYKAKTTQIIGQWIKINEPISVDNFRFMLILKGNAHVSADLIDYTIGPNTIGFMATGGIVQFHELSPNLEIVAMVLRDDLFRLLLGDNTPNAFNGTRHSFYINATQQEIDSLCAMFETLLRLINTPCSERTEINRMIGAILYFINSIYKRVNNSETQKLSHKRNMFNNFIALVNKHAAQQHKIDFYANKLCVSQKHLSSIISEVSGYGAKEWIDRAIISSAKIMLRHSNLQASEIANQLNFPNASFFSKFFHRLTGYTPIQYRNSHS